MASIKDKTCKASCQRCGKTLEGLGGLWVSGNQGGGHLHSSCARAMIAELDAIQYYELKDGCTITLVNDKDSGDVRTLQCHRETKTKAFFLCEDGYFYAHNQHDEIGLKKVATKEDFVYSADGQYTVYRITKVEYE